jgi:multidrug efflux pump subunit AcrA (membrane-fusion protein)
VGIVFTKVTDDLFEVRRVDVGGRNGEYVEILAGLMPEEQIVAAHSFTVKSEFLKARLGAGCVDE